MSAADPFEVLGVAPRFGLPAAELRSRWMRAAAAAHPDADGGVDSSAEVNAAYHELADPLKRAAALLRRLGAPAVADPGLPQDFLLEAMGIMVCQEVLPLFRGGWQAGERMVQSRQQDIGWGLGGRFQPFPFQPGQDETIDGIANP